MDIQLNSEPVKYALIALMTPVWMPFAKALWQELNDSLRDEGGIFGAAPTKEEMAKLERERGRFETLLVSTTWEEQERLDSRDGGAPQRKTASGGSTPRSSARPAQRGGFR